MLNLRKPETDFLLMAVTIKIRKSGEENLIFRTTNSSRYELPVNYYNLTTEEKRIGIRYHVNEVEQLLNTLHNRKLKMGELEVELAAYLNRNQIKYLITKLVEDGIVTSDGAGRGTKYFLFQHLNMADNVNLIKNILDTLHKKYSAVVEKLPPPISMN